MATATTEVPGEALTFQRLAVALDRARDELLEASRLADEAGASAARAHALMASASVHDALAAVAEWEEER